MTRSERLFIGKMIGTYNYGIIKVINNCNSLPSLYYAETENDLLYNGKLVDIDIYTSGENGKDYAVIV